MIIIVGNKIDKTDEEEVSYQEGKDYADKVGAMFKLTSAKEGKGITVFFNDNLGYVYQYRREVF